MARRRRKLRRSGRNTYAKRRAKRKARQVFSNNKKLPKRSVLKKFANFVGKTTYKVASRTKRRRPKRSKRTRKRSRRRY